jgi:hypothetical protein
MLTSFLPPPAGRIMTLYLIIDVLLLFGCVGLYEFKRLAVRFLETLGLLLEILGALILIARDLALLKSEAYPFGALLFAVGLDLFAIGSWRSRTFARWILMLLILSTVIGPIGFFTPGLAILFAASGLLFCTCERGYLDVAGWSAVDDAWRQVMKLRRLGSRTAATTP